MTFAEIRDTPEKAGRRHHLAIEQNSRLIRYVDTTLDVHGHYVTVRSSEPLDPSRVAAVFQRDLGSSAVELSRPDPADPELWDIRCHCAD